MRKFLLIPLFATLVCGAEYRAPAGERPTAPRPGAISVLPGGRLLEPHGRQFATGPGPFGLAVNPKGRYVVTANGGPEEFSLSLLDRDDRGRFRIRQLKAPKEGTDEAQAETWRSVFMGVAFANNEEVFVSEGNAGRVRRMNITKRNVQTQLYELNRGDFEDSYTGDLAYDAARNLLYVVDQANFRVVIIDVKKRQSVASVRVGRLPFAITLSPDGKRVYVTNVGMFEYQPVPSADPEAPEERGLQFPAFGFPSPEAENGTRAETAQGSVDVPGLGDPNVRESNSLCVIDVESPLRPKVIRYVRTGKAVGEGSHGGSSPSGVLATANRIYVSNAHNDTISVIDARSLRIVREIPIRIPGLEDLRGVMPAGLAFHPQTGWLFVAEAGINAVGVIDTRRGAVIGHIPAAWYPVSVRVAGDDVYVANALGHGSGANANRMIATRDRRSRDGAGAVTTFPVPAARDLKQLTRRVMETNGFVPLRRAKPPVYPKELKHVVLIVKESRTFDEVFGDIGSAGTEEVDGAPMLARFGTTGSTGDAGGGFQRRFSLRAVNVTPNHHAMAERWSLSDNFYSDAETSVEAHHWLAGVPPNPWTMSSLLAAYGGKKDFRLPTTAPGRLLFAESASAVHPEEIPENGTLWDHLERHGVTFRSFGEGFELAGVRQDQAYTPTGGLLLTNAPMPMALFRNTSRRYPQYNTNIPDQYRVDQFTMEIEQLYVRQGKPLPRFLFVHLPNDDMALARPEDGYPFTASFVADNDYALGRIVGYLSKTPWWKEMVIFVVEDEGHGGVDHVDAHRIPFLAIGPYIRQDNVSHRNVSFPGLLKTIFQVLNIPPLNLFDAAATDLGDLFMATPDYTSYVPLEVRKELFIPADARIAERPR